MDTQVQRNPWKALYRWVSLCLSLIFALVGLLFLISPDSVVLFFNTLSRALGFAETPAPGFSFYQILAVGYMYLVTVLAYFMYKQPENTFFPRLLIYGKSASSLISFFFFLVHLPALLYLANGIIDGSIAVGVYLVHNKSRGQQQ